MKLAELIATRIKAPDVELFMSDFFEACFKCTGVKVKPSMIHSYCVGQLKTGIIAATRGYGQVRTHIKFENAFCVLFIRIADMMEKEIAETGNWIKTVKCVVTVVPCANK